MFRQSINDVMSKSQAKFINNKDKIYSVGGILVQLYNNSYGRFVDAFLAGVTAADYFEAEVKAVNLALPSARETAGIK